MARRIELPSADELFGDQPQQPPAGRTTRKAAPKKAAAKRATPTKGTSGAVPKRRGPRKSSADARLTVMESRLAALSVDALIDLRDGLEDLLSADTLDEAAVRHLLDTVGA